MEGMQLNTFMLWNSHRKGATGIGQTHSSVPNRQSLLAIVVAFAAYDEQYKRFQDPTTM